MKKQPRPKGPRTNAIGRGTQNITANIPDDMVREINAMAKESGVSRSAYVRILLAKAIREQLVVKSDLKPR